MKKMKYPTVTKCSQCGGKVGPDDPKNGTAKKFPRRVFQKRKCPHCFACYQAEQISGPII